MNYSDIQKDFMDAAQMIREEHRDYGTDLYDLVHQYADGHAWTIYHGQALELCTTVSYATLNAAEEELEECEHRASSLFVHASMIAYFIIKQGVEAALCELMEGEFA